MDYRLPGVLEPIFDSVREALWARAHSYYDGNDRRDYANAIVARLNPLPNTVAIAGYQLARSRVDVAIFTPTFCAALQFMTEGDEYRGEISKAKRACAGTDAFDYAVLFDLTRTGNIYGVHVRNGLDYGSKVPTYREAGNRDVGVHVACFTWPDHDTKRFIPLDDTLPTAWDTPRTVRELVGTLIHAQRPKRNLGIAAMRAYIFKRALRRMHPKRESTLTGAIIASALVDHLESGSPTPAAIIREPRLGTGSHDTIADCLHVSPTSLDLYEIKGETDHVTRLERQVQAYDEIGSTCTLVTTATHREKYLARIPAHLGLMVASRVGRRDIAFETIRAAAPNPNQVALTIAHMMRGPMLKHTLDVLTGRRTSKGVYEMRERISKALPLRALVTLAGRDCAFRYTTDGMRSSTVREVGKLEQWPSIQHIAFDAVGALPDAGGPTPQPNLETRYVGPLFAETNA